MDSVRERLTSKQRFSQNKKWFRDKLDKIANSSYGQNSLLDFSSEETETKKMSILYDLFNNIISKSDFEHVSAPYGLDVGSLPADFTNKDILSNKIKAVLGMEMKRPFSAKVIAINEEATTRKEQLELEKLKAYVNNSIMAPIEATIRKRVEEENKGKELTPEEREEIEKSVQEELKTMTPREIKNYMSREHQDPAEILHSQLLRYLTVKEKTDFRFSKGFKHALISAREIYWVGEVGRHPIMKVVNPLHFDMDTSTEKDFIEEAEWASYRFWITPSELEKYFGEELTSVEKDHLVESYNHGMFDNPLDFTSTDSNTRTGIPVMHAEFKSLKPIKFRYFRDESGEIDMDIVDENYEIIEEAGDIKLEVIWAPFVFEGYLIGKDTYAGMGEVIGQYKTVDNLMDCSLSYCGAIYDDLNSKPTSLMSRGKFYQYLYNIIVYRIELLTASDEGKKLLISKNLFPKSSGLSMEKWMHFFTVNNIGIVDPTEEGKRVGGDVGSNVKEVDMSLASDINRYIELAMYIEQRCGQAMGVSPQTEGQIGQYESVGSVQTAIAGTANVLEPLFDLHNHVKRNVLAKLLDTAKCVYGKYQPKILSYVLDDMSFAMIKMDYELLMESVVNLFVANSYKSHEALEAVKQLSHAALQNQTAELTDILKIMRSESIQEAEELLLVAQQNRVERESLQQQSEQQFQMEQEDKKRAHEELIHKRELEKIQLKGDLDIQKQVILSMGFDENKDSDNDGTPDVLEVAKFGVDAEIKRRKMAVEEKALAFKEKAHEDTVRLKEKEIQSKNKK